MTDTSAVRRRFLEGIASQQAKASNSRYQHYNIPPALTSQTAKPLKADDLKARLEAQGLKGLTSEQILAIAEATKSQRGPPTRRIPYSDNQALATVVSHHGIQHIPELGSVVTGQLWLDQQKAKAAKAGDEKALAKWNKYAVSEQDFDQDPNTIDNVVIYDTTNPGNVYSVDGYRLKSRDDDLINRTYYTQFPTKELRKTTKDTPQHRAWEKKYPTERLQEAHPFTKEFVDYYEWKRPLYSLILEYVTALANTACFFTTRVDPSNTKSDTKVFNRHYTAILSKVSAKIYKTKLGTLVDGAKSLYRSPSDGSFWQKYDFETDPQKVLKNKDFMRNAKNVWEGSSMSDKAKLIDAELVANLIIEAAAGSGIKFDLDADTAVNSVRGLTDPAAKALNERRKQEAAQTKVAPSKWSDIYARTNADLFASRGRLLRRDTPDNEAWVYEAPAGFNPLIMNQQPAHYGDLSDRFRGRFPLKRKPKIVKEGEGAGTGETK
jgi:hypothetical protein